MLQNTVKYPFVAPIRIWRRHNKSLAWRFYSTKGCLHFDPCGGGFYIFSCAELRIYEIHDIDFTREEQNKLSTAILREQQITKYVMRYNCFVAFFGVLPLIPTPHSCNALHILFVLSLARRTNWLDGRGGTKRQKLLYSLF